MKMKKKEEKRQTFRRMEMWLEFFLWFFAFLGFVVLSFCHSVLLLFLGDGVIDHCQCVIASLFPFNISLWMGTPSWTQPFTGITKWTSPDGKVKREKWYISDEKPWRSQAQFSYSLIFGGMCFERPKNFIFFLHIFLFRSNFAWVSEWVPFNKLEKYR